MHEVRSRRVARGTGARITVVAMVLLLAACHGGGSVPSAGSPGATVDVKGACAALAGLERSSDALNGIDVSDPTASETALTKAIAQYSAALIAFERVGPLELRARAAAVRTAVVAHHFGQAIAARSAIDAWSVEHCS